MLKAVVEKCMDLKDTYCVVIHKKGIDADWWNVFESKDKKACQDLAKHLNKVFRTML